MARESMLARKSEREASESPIGLLVGDDEIHARRYLKKLLNDQGFAVSVAANGQQAVRLAGSPNVQVVLLDSMMPGRYDGIETARRIREEHPDKAILFVSAHSWNEVTRQRAAEVGLEDVEWIQKPITGKQTKRLLDAVRRIAREVEKRRLRPLLETARAEGVGPRLILRLLRQWGLEVDEGIVEEVVAESRQVLLDELHAALAETRSVLARSPGDFQAVQMAFGPFKKAVLERLWDLYEKADPEHRRLASLFDVAVRQLSSFELEEKHVEALEFVLRCLAKPSLAREEIRECKRTLRHRGIEILMDLGKYREPLLAMYRDDEGGEDEIETSSR